MRDVPSTPRQTHANQRQSERCGISGSSPKEIDLSTELIFPAGSSYDMRNEPLGPYRLTLAEFEARPVPAIQRERREAIRRLAKAMQTVDLDGSGFERITPEHEFAKPINHHTQGVYVREFRMRAGMRIIGRRHAQEHINIISAGRATVFTELGKQEIEAPCVFTSPAGTQRFLHIHEDMVWQTIHRTDETEEEKIIAALTIDEDALGLPP